uniref:Uncharacterized protein n=1 Tax=Ditylenchus dipsaci TaxID=166011 RepID=A0A915DXY5_9BILA
MDEAMCEHGQDGCRDSVKSSPSAIRSEEEPKSRLLSEEAGGISRRNLKKLNSGKRESRLLWAVSFVATVVSFGAQYSELHGFARHSAAPDVSASET